MKCPDHSKWVCTHRSYSQAAAKPKGIKRRNQSKWWVVMVSGELD